MPVPNAVVTDTLPVAPPATTAFMLVGLSTVYDAAAVPPKLTAVALQKLVPVNITAWPVAAAVGVNKVTVGAAAADNAKVAALVPVPAGLVTDMVPEAPHGTVAVICVALFTVKVTAAVPPNVTAVAPVKFVPVITSVAAPAARGEVMPVTVGAPIKPASVAVPPGVVTETVLLLVAPTPTTAVILVELNTVNDATATPPRLTTDAPVKLVPVMVTVAPAAADVGKIEVIVGADTVKVTTDVAVPPGVVTETVPVVPLPTTALMLVALSTT